jgi:hypothetical protein
MQQGFEDIAFATPEKFHSPCKWRWNSAMTGRGTLAVSPGRALFVVPSGSLEIRDPEQVAVVRIPVPWLALLLSNVLIVLFVFGGITRELTPKNPESYVVVIGIDVLYIVVYRRQRWVEIVYAGEKGQPERAYFTPSSQLGWWPSPRKVERLCDEIRSALRADADGAAAPESAAAPASPPAEGQRSVTVVCEDCGGRIVFLARDFGTVQGCPHCGGYVDVENADE